MGASAFRLRRRGRRTTATAASGPHRDSKRWSACRPARPAPASGRLGGCLHPDDRSRYDAGFRYAASTTAPSSRPATAWSAATACCAPCASATRAPAPASDRDRGRDRGGRGPACGHRRAGRGHYHLERARGRPRRGRTTPPSWTTAATGASSTPARAGRRCSGAFHRAASRSPRRCGSRSCPTTASASTTHLHALARGESAALRLPASQASRASAGSRSRTRPRLGDAGRLLAEGLLLDVSDRVAPRTSCHRPLGAARASRPGPTRSSTPTSSSRTAATRCSCPSPATRA